MDIKQYVREDIRNMKPYEPHPLSDAIKMDANENPYLFPKSVIEDLVQRIQENMFTRYPDPVGDELRSRIASINGIEKENVVLGNGSDELIQLILQTFGGPGRRCIIPVPTFSMYKIHSQITGTETIEIPRSIGFNLPIDRMVDELKKPEATVTFVATPNNPTGNAVSLEELERLITSSDAIVVIDEAYIDFGGQTAVGLLEKYPNLIVLRTFSKVALAGMRIGYIMASEAITGELLKIKQPYNVNTMTQLAALVVLDNWSKFQAQINNIVAGREHLENELAKIPGIDVRPSDANFILFETDKPRDIVHEELLEGGVLIRGKLGGHPLERCLRVTVGTEEENELFLRKLTDIMNG